MNPKPLRLVAALSILAASSAWADNPFVFNTGNVDGRMAVASRPGATGVSEIEAADDFTTSGLTTITGASFTGLLTAGAGLPSVSEIVIEIYRVFPNDSNTVRLPQVPTRVNSPSDVAFDSRDSAVAGDLVFSTSVLSNTFTANNSVQPGGIHPTPGQTTGGNGAITGQEVAFNIVFSHALLLPSDHYFFVPQVTLTNGAQFYWLSSARPIVAPGTPFPPGVTDLQSWTRDDGLDPDWLRVGTDIVGGATPPTFNQAFSLSGTVAAVSEPESWALMLAGLAGVSALARRTRRGAGAKRRD
jgi:hypothetical protein